MGTNNYFKLVDETMNILNTFTKTSKVRVGKKSMQKNENTTKVVFAKKNMSKMTCYHCGDR